MKTNTIGPISIESPSIELGASLRQHAEDHIIKAVSKSFNNLINGTVHFKPEGELYHARVHLKVGGGRATDVVGDYIADNCYSAFNGALAKCSRQLKKHKVEMRDDHKHAHIEKGFVEN